ncbi:MAG: uncharacterized protein JWP97_3547 [Labilithrix sp.]|nr:uncharacterized protein [Labilithrix sp.]
MRRTSLGLSSLLLASFALAACSSSSSPGTTNEPPAGSNTPATPEERTAARAALPGEVDALTDLRFEATDEDRASVARTFAASGLTFAELDAIVRAGRASYPAIAQTEKDGLTRHTFTGYITDYSAPYFLSVPQEYDPAKAWPLVFVAHGGNSAMSVETATTTALDYLRAYAPALGTGFGAIVVAPATTVGWLGVGNTILFDTISQLSRRFHLDPDRVYVTGQSMGGHMSYRTALTFGDRFAAFSPQSGGYDYASAERGDIIANLFGTSAYVTYGTAAKGELYGIGDDNNKNKAWLEAHHYDWTMVEKDGGHDIYADEQPKVAAFFGARTRNAYPKRTYAKVSGGMAFTTEKLDTWSRGYDAVAGRVLRWNARHWLEVTPRPDFPEALTFHAEVSADNVVAVEAKNVRHLRVYVHPAMGLDLGKPITVRVNGEPLFTGTVTPSIATYLQVLRDFDDRGRLYWAAIDVDVTTDHDVPEPTN